MENFFIDALDADTISLDDPEVAYNGYYTTEEWYFDLEDRRFIVEHDDSTTPDHIS